MVGEQAVVNGEPLVRYGRRALMVALFTVCFWPLMPYVAAMISIIVLDGVSSTSRGVAGDARIALALVTFNPLVFSATLIVITGAWLSWRVYLNGTLHYAEGASVGALGAIIAVGLSGLYSWQSVIFTGVVVALAIGMALIGRFAMARVGILPAGSRGANKSW